MKMIHITEQKINELVQKTLAKIKSTDNPYENLKFVTEIFKDSPSNLQHSIKHIIKRKFNGLINKNLFESASINLSPAHHLYNFLYEHNLLSKYNQVAEYMNYPNITSLNEAAFDSGEPNEQDLLRILNLPKDKIKNKTIIIDKNELNNLSIIKSGAIKSLKKDYDYKVDEPEPSKTLSMREKLLAARERQGKPALRENDDYEFDAIDMSYDESNDIENTAKKIIEDFAVGTKDLTKKQLTYFDQGWYLNKINATQDNPNKTKITFNVRFEYGDEDTISDKGKINIYVDNKTQDVIGGDFDILGVTDEVEFYEDDNIETPF
jgi:hypothetical protein